MTGTPLYIVDAFAQNAFQGNPAAVCILDSKTSYSDDWMQNVAVEMNLSETAFVDFENKSLRWFTPAAEVDLCGHATVGTAKALQEFGLAQTGDLLEFQTRSGILSALLKDSDKVELDFPATPPEEIEPDEQLSKLFPNAVYFGKSRFDLLVEIESHDQLKNMEPDFDRLKKLKYRGIIVTAKSNDSKFDFVSRFFAPAFGIDEDPVTGSAHCCLAPYWGLKLSKSQMKAAQISKRGGVIELELFEDRVKLVGGAVLVMKGTLFPDANS